MCNHLFVYGTLHRALGHRAHHFLAANAEPAGQATVRGRLYHTGAYPVLFLSDDPEDVAHGELYKLLNPVETLQRLDFYEGFEREDESGSLFIRSVVEVTTAGGEKLDAWAYTGNMPVDGLRFIKSGDALLDGG